MPEFSQISRLRLASCHPALQAIFEAVIEDVDCVVIEGHRGKAAQDAAFAGGKSQLPWPKGKHNATPSLAVDVAPSPIDWNDRDRFHLFAGYVLGIARVAGYRLRWGGDWARTFKPKENRFDDLVHFELMPDPPKPLPEQIA